jgi:hypothetical protein
VKEEFSLKLMEECQSTEDYWRQKNFYIYFVIVDYKSLISAGEDHLEGLNPGCNGILICEIVHLPT